MDNQPIQFTMNYYALKTFGRQQYSNAWAAISELIANGFDAGATNVWLYIDMVDQSSATVEIFDNGCGMNEDDLKTKYAVIGRNRRLDNTENKSADKAAGRKGIGKLAALYLSDSYQIISKKEGVKTAWSVDVANKNDIDIPSLEPIDASTIKPVCSDIWDSDLCRQGTMIRLLNVNLTRIGDRAIEALKHRLSNYFLFDSIESTLQMCIIRHSTDIITFEKVEKQIAFDNMSHIYYSDISQINKKKDTFVVEYFDKAKVKQQLTVKQELIGLPDDINGALQSNKIALSATITINGKTKTYKLEGWIGVHSTIDNTLAQKNDSRYVKNQFYNPNQIRIYVRNKLANENVLDRLGLVGTYNNYIEGEISFNILDDNDFEDIATSNRQDFSIIDERVHILYELLRGICRQLLQRRQELADKISTVKDTADKKIQSSNKTRFAKETHKDLISAGLTQDKADELSVVITNKLQGEYELKNSYKLFISHSSKDRIFTDFISHYLQSLGFKWDKDNPDKTDIFYSSDGLPITDSRPLADIIKKMIIDDNTDILFLTSQNFLNSEFCLFEGGAAWATRSVLEYSLVAIDYDKIPKYLTNGKSEFSFNSNDKATFTLNQQNYINLVTVLNRIITHLNKNREIAGAVLVSLLDVPIFPDLVQMDSEKKIASDYMDLNLCKYWKSYVLDKLDVYIDHNNKHKKREYFKFKIK
jgi:Molecular chaperone, HSP90 family